MLLIDPRSGSGEFSEFRKLFAAHSIQVELEQLPFGDFAFLGNCVDKNGRPDEGMIGVERKALGDLLTCMRDNRFVGHQLPGMLESYHLSFLVVEGMWRPDSEGYVEAAFPLKNGELFCWRKMYQGRNVILYSALSNYLNTLRLKSGLVVVETADKASTAWFVASLHKWFEKPWESHTSHLSFYDPASVLRLKSSLVRRCAVQLSGIGQDKSALIDKAFGSVLEMALANEETWLEKVRWEAGGKNMTLGKATVAKIVNEIRGGKNGSRNVL